MSFFLSPNGPYQSNSHLEPPFPPVLTVFLKPSPSPVSHSISSPFHTFNSTYSQIKHTTSCFQFSFPENPRSNTLPLDITKTMASDKAIKKNTDMMEVQEPKVSKLTNQFEALAEKASRGLSEMDISPEAEAHAHAKAKESHGDKPHTDSKTKTKTSTESKEAQGKRKEPHHFQKDEKHTNTEGGKAAETEAHRQGENKNSPSLEEIGQLRAQAQQNSMEALRSAEERHAKATTEAGSGALQPLYDVKESVVHGLGAVSSYVADKSVAAKDTTLEKGQQALSYTTEKAQKGLGATKETTLGAGKTALDYTGKKTVEAKEAAVSTGGSAAHYVGEKAVQVKDTALNVGKTAVSYAGEKAYEGKEASVGVGKTVVDYTKETAEKAKELALKKAAEAKDVLVSSGESAVSYVGEKAVQAKDVTLESGKSAASYVGEKAVQVKDVTLETGKNALDIAGQKASEAKGAAVDTSKSALEKGSSKISEAKTDVHQKKDEVRGEKQVVSEGGGEGKENIEVGLLGAVGETFVEIAKTAKEIVVGDQKEHVTLPEKKQQ